MHRKTVSFFVVLLLVTGVGAQAPSQGEQSEPRFRVERRVVLVDVVVRDRSGKPVTDLTRENFQITEDGKEQEPAFFSLERAGTISEGEATPLPPVIILLDNLNTSFSDVHFARRAVTSIVERVQPGQRVAIYGLGNDLVLLHGFTTDRDALLRAVDIRNRSSRRDVDMSAEIETMAQAAIATGDPNVIGAIVRILRDLERFEADLNRDILRMRADRTAAALRSIARGVRSTTGRKSLIWLSAAFPRFHNDPRQTLNFSDVLHAAASDLNDAQVSVYPVHTGGVGAVTIQASGQGSLSRGAGLGDPTRAVRELSDRARNIDDSLGTLKDLADWTGGRPFYNSNDLTVAYTAAIEDNSAYYTLAYYPTNQDWNARYRRINVKVQGRSGMEVRHRQGYYALAPEHQRSKQISERDLRDALLINPALLEEISINARIAPQSKPGTPPQVDFLVDAGSLDRQAIAASGKGTLDFAVALIRPNGSVATSATQTISFDAKGDLEGRLLTHALPLRATPSKGDRVRVAVRDAHSGAMATMDLEVQ